MPYLYFLVLLIFLVLYSSFVTFQLYKLIKIESFFKKNVLSNVDLCNMDQFFIALKLLSYKKLWFASILLVERQKKIPKGYIHRYFNVVGFIYYNMQEYDFAKLYYLKSLNEKNNYLVALSNLAKVYEKKNKYSDFSK